MTPFDPMAVAVDWLDAYRAARINQIVGMHSPDAVIECACGGRRIIYGHEGIAAHWRERLVECPRLIWKSCMWREGQWLSPTEPAVELSRRVMRECG